MGQVKSPYVCGISHTCIGHPIHTWGVTPCTFAAISARPFKILEMIPYVSYALKFKNRSHIHQSLAVHAKPFPFQLEAEEGDTVSF